MGNSRCAILVPAGHSIEPNGALTLGQLEARGYPVRPFPTSREMRGSKWGRCARSFRFASAAL